GAPERLPEERRLGEGRCAEDLLERDLEVLPSGEPAGEPALPRGVIGVGRETSRAISVVPENFGDRRRLVVERRLPAATVVLRIQRGEEAAVRGERPRAIREGVVEHDPLAADAVDGYGGRARVAVQAQALRAHRVEQEDQNVRRVAADGWCGAFPPP